VGLPAGEAEGATQVDGREGNLGLGLWLGEAGKELERSGAGRHLAADAKAFTVRVQPWRPASSVARCRRKVLLTGPAISSAVARDRSSTPSAIRVRPGAGLLGRRPGVKGQPQSWAGVSPRQPGRRPGVKENSRSCGPA
jgi:hypothetical protein